MAATIRPPALKSAASGKELAKWYHRNGYVRRLNPKRRRAEKSAYKKGDEVRLVANSLKEVAAIKRMLKQAGFRAGRPFEHSRQYRVPIYGRQEVARFLALVAKPSSGKSTRKAPLRRRVSRTRAR
ncbi:MAG: hypothetical protein ACT4PU_08380 [Planctomycetota bacterium]